MTFSFQSIFRVFLINFTVYSTAVAIKITKIYYNKKIETASVKFKQAETLIKLKDAEIQLLKAQLHPHFLFNTLNNLYGLTIAKSDKAPDIVIRISELLDYMLYECNSNTAKLVNEIKYLRNYIELEKIRYKNKLKIEYSENGISEKHLIAPLLLLPFLENSFKHGVSKQLKESCIKIDIQVKSNILLFEITNSKAGTTKNNLNTSKGIGITNVKKRLELLYKNHYKLELKDQKVQYSVKLELELINLNSGN
jgi:LytS/YehU family sensor histidine kinase